MYQKFSPLFISGCLETVVFLYYGIGYMV